MVLDRGQEDDWFVSHLISFLAVSLVVSLVGFVIWELTRRRPVLDLRLFKNRSFAAAAAMIFVYGVQVYAMTVFIPQFMQAFMGYDNMEVITGGTPYGATTLAGPDGRSRPVSDNELAIARFQGRHVASVARRFKSGTA